MSQILYRSLKAMRLLRGRIARRKVPLHDEHGRNGTHAESILTRFRETFEILARK